MRVAVTGATGYVGRFLVEALLGAGHEVRAWRRPSSDVGGFSASITWIEGGLGVAGSEAALLEGAQALVHAAFEHVPGRYRGGEGDDVEGFLATNQAGSVRLLDSADRLGVGRVVFLSSRAVYGPRLWDRPLDEDHPTRPDTHYGAYKLAVEKALEHRARGRAWSSLRATGVYGLGAPLARSKWYEVVRASLGSEVPPPRGGTEVSGEDVARAVMLLLDAEPEAVAGRAFNASDVYVTHRAVTRLTGGVLAPPSPQPTGVMATDRLRALGWRPQGWKGVANTVERLAGAVRAERLDKKGSEERP